MSMTDDKPIVSSLHNHTNLCDGADSPSDMAAAAYATGITDFGFSAHSHAPFDLNYAVRDERGYIAAVRDIKAAYRGKMNVYLGLEEDLFAPSPMRAEYDYRIASVHYFRRGQRYFALDASQELFDVCLFELFNGDIRFLAAEYFYNVIASTKTGAAILGHIDLILKYGSAYIKTDAGYYRDAAFDAVKAAIKADMVIELNYGGVAGGSMSAPYPHRDLLLEIKRLGGRVTVSTDCHDKNKVAFGLNEGREYLKSLGFSSVYVYHDGKFVESDYM